MRIRSEADRIVERDWSLFSWEDPDGDAVSAFFDTPMPEGEGAAQARPLMPMLEAAGVRVEGLRLDCGTLVLKVEKDTTPQARFAEGLERIPDYKIDRIDERAAALERNADRRSGSRPLIVPGRRDRRLTS